MIKDKNQNFKSIQLRMKNIKKLQSMYKEPIQLESINQFESNQKSRFHSPYYQRIKQQVNSLIFEPPDNFYVTVFQQTKVRIVLRIKYFMLNPKIETQTRIKAKSIRKNQKSQSSASSNQVQTIFMQQDQNHIHFNDSIEDANIFLQKNSKIEQNYVLFTCIINYGIYPLSPPYLIVTQSIDISYDLTINNFSNITDEILQNSNWFPSFTLEDILKNIPSCVENLKQNSVSIKSSYYYERPFRKLDICQHALGLKVYEGETFDRKDVFFGKYAKKTIGITFKSLILFKKDETNGLKVCNVFSLSEIQKVNVEENLKRIKFTINFQQQIETICKFTFQKDSKKGPEQIELKHYFLNWMKLCLSKAIYQKFNKKQAHPPEIQASMKKTSTQKGKKISNAQNEHSIYNFTYGLEERDMEMKKKQIEKHLIQKQEHIMQILQTVDLLISSPVYRSYDHQSAFEQVDEIQIKPISPTHSNDKFKNKSWRPSFEVAKDNSTDLTKNEFIKLKHLKRAIEDELKQIFTLL